MGKYIKYRNTGFMRQVFIYLKGKYAGLEFNKYYFRVYKITPEGVLPRYREISILKPLAPKKPNKEGKSE